MNYHIIRTDDMLNGDGLRVVLFVSGCHHRCDGCHNPETWDVDGGKVFTEKSMAEIYNELDKEYISGITLSGGDPLAYENLPYIYDVVSNVRRKYPRKSIWLYTGYTWEHINAVCKGLHKVSREFNEKNRIRKDIVSCCDVVCDGKFVKSLADVNCPWVGSTNQRVIDVRETIKRNEIVLWKS